VIEIVNSSVCTATVNPLQTILVLSTKNRSTPRLVKP